MTTQITFCVPVAPYHSSYVGRALDSIKAQTVPCDYLVYHDHDRRGAGYARNRLLEQVSSFFVSFLDADDTIEPTFAASCLEVWRPGRYVYTDWLADYQVNYAPPPCIAWTNKTNHLITTVIPTEAARRIGGFDELMPGAEDTDFYTRLVLSGVCGIQVHQPLLHYRPGGQRSIALKDSGQEAAMLDYMRARYGQYEVKCCDTL